MRPDTGGPRSLHLSLIVLIMSYSVRASRLVFNKIPLDGRADACSLVAPTRVAGARAARADPARPPYCGEGPAAGATPLPSAMAAPEVLPPSAGEGSKPLSGLLNGIAQAAYYGKAGITEELLRGQLYPEAAPEEFRALRAKMGGLLQVSGRGGHGAPEGPVWRGAGPRRRSGSAPPSRRVCGIGRSGCRFWVRS